MFVTAIRSLASRRGCGRLVAVAAALALTAASHAPSHARQRAHAKPHAAPHAAAPAPAPAATVSSRLPRPRPAGAGRSESAATEPAASEPQTAPDDAAPAEAAAAPGDSPDQAAEPASEAAAPAEAATAAAGPASSAAGDADHPPLPRPRPELTEAEMARILSVEFYGFDPDFVLRAALDAEANGSYAEAREIADRHDNALVPALITWLIARESDSGMSAAEIVSVLESHVGWPEPERLQLRAEQAFHALGPDPDAVLAFYQKVRPRTTGGKLALAGALREAGRSEEAQAIARKLWRDESLAPGQAASLLGRFGDLLERDDHLYRFRRLVLGGDREDAIVQAQVLGPGYDDLARAVIATRRRSGDAESLLRKAAETRFFDPLYIYAIVDRLRRSNQPVEAARLLIATRPDATLAGDGDAWWDQRRDISRELLDHGLSELAYRVVAEAHPDGEGDRVEAAFHAGWYALRFLHDPIRALPHFRVLHTLATLPRTQSRASYWLGRAHEAEGHLAAARLDYVEAARFGETFYGQLSRQRLGMVTTGLERSPRPSALDRIRFARRNNVKIIRLLAAAGHPELARPFFARLGEVVDTPGEMALVAALARRIGEPGAGVAAASEAEERGLKVGALPLPFAGVPAGLTLPARVDRALVYAVARQESAFNHTAVSHAGARGLMQLMPSTARATARIFKLPFSEERLTTDPLYNATLGAHHLGELLGNLKRSYVLTFVGYNAGPGRALQWVRDYGDPRSGTIDPIDWIERIPFDETRDYVQKVMENLQSYRSRTGHPLSLMQDLVRGKPQS